MCHSNFLRFKKGLILIAALVWAQSANYADKFVRMATEWAIH